MEYNNIDTSTSSTDDESTYHVRNAYYRWWKWFAKGSKVTQESKEYNLDLPFIKNKQNSIFLALMIIIMVVVVSLS